MDLFDITREDMICEVQREIDMRTAVYARQVANGMLRHEVAARRIAVMQAVLDLLRRE